MRCFLFFLRSRRSSRLPERCYRFFTGGDEVGDPELPNRLPSLDSDSGESTPKAFNFSRNLFLVSLSFSAFLLIATMFRFNVTFSFFSLSALFSASFALFSASFALFSASFALFSASFALPSCRRSSSYLFRLRSFK